MKRALKEILIAVVGCLIFLVICGRIRQHEEDDAERDRQQQIAALCSAAWPDAQNAKISKYRACGH